MSKKQIVAILMLSPIYFTMTLKQRLAVVLRLSRSSYQPAGP